jgi:hypothetical protein
VFWSHNVWYRWLPLSAYSFSKWRVSVNVFRNRCYSYSHHY